MYSGYTMDKEILNESGKVHTKYSREILEQIDILVDGRFVCELMNLALKFRGSSNQRIINIQESIRKEELIEWIL